MCAVIDFAFCLCHHVLSKLFHKSTFVLKFPGFIQSHLGHFISQLGLKEMTNKLIEAHFESMRESFLLSGDGI